jgi:hypothetical protein
MKAGELGTAKAGVSVDADTGGPQLGKCLGEFAPEVIRALPEMMRSLRRKKSSK